MKWRKFITLAGMLACILLCLRGQPALADSGKAARAPDQQALSLASASGPSDATQPAQKPDNHPLRGSPPPGAQDARPPVGGITSPEDAMIFYRAHRQSSDGQSSDGQNGACGSNCADWIAAEGVVEWDTFKRLFAFLERFGAPKLPVVLNVRGNGSLNVAVTLGKIIREHELDVSAGTTFVAGCTNATAAACFARKRSGQPLDARIDTTAVGCDVVCVLVLAGGVHRALPAGARVIIEPTHIINRFAPNVSPERQRGLQASYGDQYRLYLTQMGVDPEIADTINRNAQTGRATEILSQDWRRLGLVTEPAR